MKRKEIADLLRQYRNDETIKNITTYTFNEVYQLIALSFTGDFRLPDGSTNVNMCSHKATYSTGIAFVLKIKNK